MCFLKIRVQFLMGRRIDLEIRPGGNKLLIVLDSSSSPNEAVSSQNITQLLNDLANYKNSSGPIKCIL